MGDYTAPDYTLLGDNHVERYRATGGEEGYDWNGAPTLLLTTTGRHSGEPRTAPLIFGRNGDDYLVVASVGGSPKHPGWYFNLQDHPRVTVQVKTDVFEADARVATDAEKPGLWRIVNEVWPNYDVYQSRTERVIPIVVLTPRS